MFVLQTSDPFAHHFSHISPESEVFDIKRLRNVAEEISVGGYDLSIMIAINLDGPKPVGSVFFEATTLKRSADSHVRGFSVQGFAVVIVSDCPEVNAFAL
jgi:hypothetical protein